MITNHQNGLHERMMSSEGMDDKRNSSNAADQKKKRGGTEKKSSPDQLEWKELNYLINQPIKKHIIHNAFGTVKKGEICALIGSSGAGKTTLLNLLAHKIVGTQDQKITGEFSFDGMRIKSAAEMKAFSSFLRQEDFFHHNLTPREVLKFVLDLTSKEDEQIKREKVNFSLQQLNLLRCADSRVL